MDAPLRPPPPALSLVARLDHLDSVLNRLEAKQDPTKTAIRSLTEREFLPMNAAIRDAYFKGSLLDRVASLENRMFRLCLEVDSTGSSNHSILNHPPICHHRQPSRDELPEIQEEANIIPGNTKEQKKKKRSNTATKKSSVKKASCGGKDDNSAIVRRKGKRRNSSTFMNILGCTL